MLQLGPFSLRPLRFLPAQPWSPPCSLESVLDGAIVGGSVACTSDVYEEQEGDLPLRTQFNEMCRFQGRLREQNPVVRHDTHRVPMNMGETLRIVSDDNEMTGEVGRTVTIVGPYSFLNSLNRLPSATRAMTSRMSNDCLRSVPTIPWSSSAGYNGFSGVASGWKLLLQPTLQIGVFGGK